MQAREAARVLGRERQAVLVAVDGLVLCAVVAEHALDLRHAPDEPDIEDEHGNAQHAVDDVPQKRVAPTMRFVMKAGATMKSTMPSASPQTIEMAISFLPNSDSGSFALGIL